MNRLNEKAILEIVDITHVRRGFLFKILTPEEIIKTYEYKQFKKQYPEICKLVEN